MRNYRNLMYAVICAVFFALNMSCTTLSERNCPYVIGNINSMCGTGDDSAGFRFAGVSFTFCNSGSKTVADFTVSFRLYDSEGENPFIGTNCVTAKKTEIIGRNSTSEITVNLDSFITVVPEEPYQVDYFYVTEIHYTDGSTWRDEYGIYAL